MRFRIVLICFAACLLLLSKKSLAQGQYAINEAHNFANNLHTVATDGSIFIYASHNGMENYLLKLDKNNQLLWGMSIQLSDSLGPIPNEITGITAMAAMPDGGFVVTGYAETGDLISNWNTVVIRFDKDGNIIWSNQYESLYSEEPGAILVKNDAIHIAGIGHSMQAMPSAVFYASISFTGEMEIFSTRFVSIERRVKSMNILPSGMICLVSESFINNKNSVCTIDLLDANGKFIYYYSSAELSKNVYPSEMEVIGSDLVLTGTATDDIGYPYMFALHIKSPQADTALPAIFYVLKGDLAHQARASVTTSDTALILGGVYDYSVLWQQKVFFARLKFSKNNLSIQWSKVFGKSNFQDMRTLDVRANGNITGVGTMFYKSNGYDIYLAETNSSGVIGCDEEDFEIDITKNLVVLEAAKPTINPRNWVESKVNVSLHTSPFTYFESLCPALPPVAGFALSDTLICVGERITIVDTAKFTAGYKWFFEGTDLAEYADADPPQLVFVTEGVFKLTQVVSNHFGVDTAIRYVQVKPRPQANAGSDVELCAGSTATLLADGGVKFEWYSAGRLINDGTSASVEVTPYRSQEYSVIAYGQTGCSDTDKVWVNVLQIPKEIDGLDTVICLGDIIELTVPEEQGLTYSWSNGSNESHISIMEEGFYTVTAQNNCFSKTATFKVSLHDCRLRFGIPDAFTPDGDLLNDSFNIIGENYTDVELKIFSRWGELLYTASGNDVHWDGTYKGKTCEEGIYIYTVVVQGILSEKKFRTGSFYLLR